MELNKDYIAVDEAVKRVGGNKGLYIRLLNQFVGGGHLGILEQALSENDTEAAIRGAHTIKGVGANLSLPKLTAAASELEQKIKKNEDYADCLNEFKGIYDTTMQQIAIVIEQG